MAHDGRQAPPDFVAVGHVTVDLYAEAGGEEVSPRFGGTAAYASLTAKALGLSAAVVTSAAIDYPFDTALPGVDVHTAASGWTTTFRNTYGPQGRSQILAARGAEITLDDVPEAWRSASIVLICPLAQELPGDAGSWFEADVLGAAPQGWMRSWDDRGRVSLNVDPPAEMSGGYDLITASSQEAGPGFEELWGPLTRVLAVTEAERGSRLLVDGRWRRIPAVSVAEEDPTGAGDVWAAAYLVRLLEVRDPMAAARFASCAASLSVTGRGLAGVPGREQVESTFARLDETDG